VYSSHYILQGFRRVHWAVSGRQLHHVRLSSRTCTAETQLTPFPPLPQRIHRPPGVRGPLRVLEMAVRRQDRTVPEDGPHQRQRGDRPGRRTVPRGPASQRPCAEMEEDMGRAVDCKNRTPGSSVSLSLSPIKDLGARTRLGWGSTQGNFFCIFER